MTTAPPWVILGDSVIGTSHQKGGKACQDAFRVAESGEWLVVAVADGAGSASRSEVGARVACEEAVRHACLAGIAPLLAEEAARELLVTVRESVLAEAERLHVRPRELACTLLVAAVGPDTSAILQIGDGVVVFGDGTDFRVPLWPEPGEYANVTDFLTDDGYAGTARFARVEGAVSEVAVLTDGLQRLALDFAARCPHPPFFAPLFRQLRAEPDHPTLFARFREFLSSPAINARTDDDKTLVLAARQP